MSRLPKNWSWHDYRMIYNDRLVADRWVYSTMAYDDMLRPVDRDLPKEDCIKLHHMFAKRTYTVGITASEDLIRHRYNIKGDDMYNLEAILQVNQWFYDNCEMFDMHLHCTESSKDVVTFADYIIARAMEKLPWLCQTAS